MKRKRTYKRKIKTIKIKMPESKMIIILQDWLLNKKVSNLGLISISVQMHIRKFVRGLKDICLSEELQ